MGTWSLDRTPLAVKPTRTSRTHVVRGTDKRGPAKGRRPTSQSSGAVTDLLCNQVRWGTVGNTLGALGTAEEKARLL